MITELSAIGDKLTEDQVIHLLASLPECYDVLVTALEANDSTLTWSHTVERLLHLEGKIKETNEEALMIKRTTLRNVRCYNCERTGHTKRTCY